jgi:hypothetical protein
MLITFVAQGIAAMTAAYSDRLTLAFIAVLA